MTNYTPDLEEVRELYWAVSGLPRRDPKAWEEFDRFIRKIQADAIRNAAIKAQERRAITLNAHGHARVRTDWLHEEADRIVRGHDE